MVNQVWHSLIVDQFASSRLKVERAKKHIDEINGLLRDFAQSDFYSLEIEQEADARINFLRIEVDQSGFPLDDIALTIGDAVHNLRSALDHLWYQVVLCCGGTPTKWTRFPVGDAGDSLVAILNSALDKKQITIPIVDLLMAGIKSYQGGNAAIWGLHNLNIRDKHEMLVPALKLMAVLDVRLEDENHMPIGRGNYYLDESSRIRLREADGRTVSVKDKGHAAAQILFDIGTPFEGDPVVPTLVRVTKEVERIVEAFVLLR